MVSALGLISNMRMHPLSLSKTMNISTKDLKLDEVKLIFPKNKRYWLGDKVEVMGLKALTEG